MNMGKSNLSISVIRCRHLPKARQVGASRVSVMFIEIQPSNFAPLPDTARACDACGSAENAIFKFSYAYQPIVDVSSRSIWGFEALVRGPAGESAQSVLSKVDDEN